MAKANPVNIRIESPTLSEIKKLARSLRLSLSALLNRLITESVRMYQCPGIIFTNSTTGRRATVSGSGLDVWEVISLYHQYKKDEKKLLAGFMLTQIQLSSALSYYLKYKEEIDEEIKENEDLDTLLSSTNEYPWIKRVKV